MKRSILIKQIQRLCFTASVLSFVGIGTPSFSQAWNQLGTDIDGEAANDFSGEAVSLSADGLTVVVGARNNTGINGIFSGHAKVYKLIGGTWTQQGADIDGEAAGDFSGSSVSINADGSVVAIGGYFNGGNGTKSGHVRVFKLIGGGWIQQAADIDGEAANDLSGWSVDLSADGLTVAIGAKNNDGNGADAGHVRIYKLVAGSWTQQGMDIDGEAAGDESGWAVGLSDDGLTVAIATPFNDGNGTNAGHVRVYKLIAGIWTQQGTDIDGEAADDRSGYALSLNADGTIVAIGSPFNAGGGNDRGHVSVFKLNADTWIQQGTGINGEANVDAAGQSVSLSADGNTVAIGGPLNDGGAAEAGHVRVYKFIAGVWTQQGTDIDGEAADDQSAWAVSLSADGSRVAIGARNNDGSGSNAGHVRLYSFTTSSGIHDNSFFERVSIFPNPNKGAVNIYLGDIKNVSIRVLDVNGQLLNKKTNINTEIYQFEINGAPGVYFIEVSVSDKKRLYKLIKE
jgi:hypothetical protein